MRTLFRIFRLAFLLVWFFPVFPLVFAQSPPGDFALSVTTGGAAPWAEKTTINIDSTGLATYSRYTAGGNPAVLAETTFTISAMGLQQLWKTIQDSSFFTLTPAASDTSVRDGTLAWVSVTANGVTHEVSVRNIAVPRLQALIETLNHIVPAADQLPYAPPPHLNYVPRDPCNPFSFVPGLPPYDDTQRLHSSDAKARAWRRPGATTSIAGLPLQETHAGTEVACMLSLPDAVASKYATLSSKGSFFGDDVSITVDNSNPHQCDNISITLYLDFWGPLATQANIDAIEMDIAKKWDGLKTSTGKTIDIGFVTKVDRGATAPPNTPGYHNIQLVPPDAVRSHVDNGPQPNSGEGECQWETGLPPGTYGHEAGHLMGLPDRYVDYHKQRDGSWVPEKQPPPPLPNLPSEPNNDAMASLIASKYPGVTAAMVKPVLQHGNLYSIPWPGSENDLMGNGSTAPPLQSDIDNIAWNPGLVVTIPAGMVYGNRSGDRQSLIGIHADAVHVPPGQIRTINGIYAACIDHDRGIPDSAGVFDVTPPVESWTGVAAAGYMAKLLHFIDSAGLYCGNTFDPQEAIWRISDNALPLLGTSDRIDSLLQAAGVNIGNQIMDFPHLTGSPSTDVHSHTFVPNELFVANIRPEFASGQIGSATKFSVSISEPAGVNAARTFSWIPVGPDSTTVTVTGADSTASVTPSKSGIFSVGLKFTVNDSAYGQRMFTSGRRGYLVVPDSYTETFEHANLTDKYPWKSFGAAPWKISTTYAQTGQFSAQPGNQIAGGSSTLGIDVSVPEDTVITFSVRSATPNLTDVLLLYEDSLFVDEYTGLSDWQIVQLPLFQGHHRLTWTAKGSEGSLGNNFWVDNIFFPGNVVVTSVAETKGENIPKVFELDQNYPNPFNPTTVIRYGLPHKAYVTLTLYNTLGQRVATLVNGNLEAGYHEVTFNASHLASGVYLLRMEAGDFVQTRKLMLVK